MASCPSSYLLAYAIRLYRREQRRPGLRTKVHEQNPLFGRHFMQNPTTSSNQSLWQAFVQSESLTLEQRTLFERYYDILMAENEKFNLTAITSLKKVLSLHFSDSLALRKHLELSKISTIADVGSGAGLPALPLKIIYPDLNMILIEVTHKKRLFLEKVIEMLDLSSIEICPLDWRTFLRTTEGEIDLFTSRATLHEVELCRLFRQTSHYRNATLVYWASSHWQADKKAETYIERIETYALGNIERKLVFLKANSG